MWARFSSSAPVKEKMYVYTSRGWLVDAEQTVPRCRAVYKFEFPSSRWNVFLFSLCFTHRQTRYDRLIDWRGGKAPRVCFSLDANVYNSAAILFPACRRQVTRIWETISIVNRFEFCNSSRRALKAATETGAEGIVLPIRFLLFCWGTYIQTDSNKRRLPKWPATRARLYTDSLSLVIGLPI